MKDKISWKTEKRKLSQLKPFERNPRKAYKKQCEDLDKSLEKFNLADPLIVNTDNMIIGGHFRYDRLLQTHGKDHVVDVRIPSRKLSTREIEELNIRLNKNQGEWNDELLANFDPELLKEAGFSDTELNFIFDLSGVDSSDKNTEIDILALTIHFKTKKQKIEFIELIDFFSGGNEGLNIDEKIGTFIEELGRIKTKV